MRTRLAAAAALMAGLLSAQSLPPAAGKTGDVGPAEHPVAPVQPIPYSHKQHIALGLKCADCHVGTRTGEEMGLPATAKCMACHSSIAADKPAIRKLAEYANANKSPPWVRVYSLPAWVVWSHRTHLNAGATCETCHGNVPEMAVMTLATNVTTMQGCVDCHRKRGAMTGCETCHEERN